MSAYSDLIDQAEDTSSTLRKQVSRAILKAAQDITGEDPATDQHAARAAWSERIRFGGVPAARAAAERFIVLVLENATIAGAPSTASDGDVQFVVNSVVNDFINKG